MGVRNEVVNIGEIVVDGHGVGVPVEDTGVGVELFGAHRGEGVGVCGDDGWSWSWETECWGERGKEWEIVDELHFEWFD